MVNLIVKLQSIDIPQVAEQFKYFAGVLTTDEGSVNQMIITL